MAANYGIEAGRSFVHEGMRITYKGRARSATGEYLFLQDDGLQVAFAPDELARLREGDRLPDWTGRLTADGRPVQPLAMANATRAEREDAWRRLDYCMAWAAQPETCRSEAGLLPLIAAVHRRRAEAVAPAVLAESPPCASSVRKWIAAWRKRDRMVDALLSAERLRGNRSRRHEPVLADLVDDFVERHYLTDKRLPVAGVHRLLKEHVLAENEKKSIDWPVPSYEAVRSAVLRLCPFTVDYCRLGAAVAREKWRVVSAGYITEYPNEVWELDDTRVDVICTLADGTVVGRPWVILVIDRHTRMIMSFVLSFHPPDTSAAMEAVRLAILSKDADLRRHGLEGASYPARGTCGTLHVDNAKHYNSHVLKRALASLGIRHETMPVLKAWYRAIVERAIGTMSRRVFHVVPGTTYAGIYERDCETPPERVATATIGKLETNLFAWMVTSYARSHHKGIQDSPLAMWTRFFAQPGVETPLPLPESDVNDKLSITVGRRVRKEGLQFAKLMYSSEHLLRLRMLPKADQKEEVVIRVDRNNLEVIHFMDPQTNEWLPCYLRQDLVPRVRGRTLEEYDIARAFRKNRPDEFEDDADWSATYSAIERANDEAAGSRWLATRVRAAGERERRFREARHLTEPKSEAPVPGDGLSDTLDQVYRTERPDDPVQEPAPGPADAPAPEPPPDPGYDPLAWAAAQGLGRPAAVDDGNG